MAAINVQNWPGARRPQRLLPSQRPAPRSIRTHLQLPGNEGHDALPTGEFHPPPQKADPSLTGFRWLMTP
jgi:hypothetical protein